MLTHSLRRSALPLILLPALVLLAGCGDEPAATAKPAPFASTYKPLPSKPTLLRNATVLIGNGQQLDNASVLLQDGKIVAVGSDVKAPDGADIIDASGKWVTPGIIDVHSHLGVYPSPALTASEDGNEMVAPDTAYAWAEHAVWPQDPQFPLALAGGVTSMQILPGSANLFGGRSVTLKNVPARTVQQMKFPGAPYGLKMACGENPKRVYGEKGGPMTRMGNVAGYRKSWIEAAKYLKDWKAYEDALAAAEGNEAAVADKMPQRDLRLETLAGVLKGEILVQNHCYRADEMAVMIDIAKEFGFKITAFHHAVEAYKVADLLAENNICAAVWADWWGFKQEAYDMTLENAAFVDKARATVTVDGKEQQRVGCAIIHSDSALGIQRLNQEAAKAMVAGRRAGIDISEAQAMRWLTENAAKALGIADKVGTLEQGKMADVVLWDRSPFSVYAHAEKVFIDGALMYDRNNKQQQAATDFELGIVKPEGERL
ncbi:amidohydrolase [Permianibacter sp. IMCC34836]|uniref:amidohydrolase n=1 Tax=Permianibacter fluminis TaxID=2738515 RepID=UPI001557C08F|nr:amidohydrolase [Permianibacter fluminis]NQD38816.1 amidohydrolase [Permianibacter fluminis]